MTGVHQAHTEQDPLLFADEIAKLAERGDGLDSSRELPRGDILVVDDKPANVRLLSSMLTEQGYKVRSVISGSMALTAARAAPPDLILLDVKMPEMDGYQVCQQLKADEKTRDIPIIFISALDDAQDKVQAFAVGGVDYVTKPFQVPEVLARVETHLALRNLQKQLQVANAKLTERLEEVAHANAELQARNEELDAFAHTVAHDLKSPLTLLIGLSGVLEDPAGIAVEEISRYMHVIAQNGRKMSNIVDELLLLASVRQIEQVALHTLDMGSVVAEAQRRLLYMVQERQAEIVLPASWPKAMGYSPWVEEVWVNYLSNAIKYGGNPPYMELGWDRSTSQPANQPSIIRFWVRDNGSGLAPEEQARLFTPFERLHQIRVQGHGLGLSIVHRIVKKLGGQVGVQSKVGEGSVFWFTLPAVVNRD